MTYIKGAARFFCSNDPMMSENSQDLRLAAERFIARYGEQAPDEARRRAAELVDAGHRDAAAEWERIAELAVGLLVKPGAIDGTIH